MAAGRNYGGRRRQRVMQAMLRHAMNPKMSTRRHKKAGWGNQTPIPAKNVVLAGVSRAVSFEALSNRNQNIAFPLP